MAVALPNIITRKCPPLRGFVLTPQWLRITVHLVKDIVDADLSIQLQSEVEISPAIALKGEDAEVAAGGVEAALAARALNICASVCIPDSAGRADGG
jgi:hypothetical protein